MDAKRSLAGASLLGLTLMAALWAWYSTGMDASPLANEPVAPNAPFVKSMEGTEPDGNLRTGVYVPFAKDGAAATAALAYAELKRLFDYYLSAVGEQSIETITQQIRLELQQRLPKAQHDAAQKLLTQYLAYKKALVAVELEQTTKGTGIAAIRQRFTAMQNLRSQYFSAQEEQAMFGSEDEQDRDALARLEVSEDPKLSAAQKRERLAAIDAAMPAALRAEREAPRQVINVENRAAEMRAAGASDDDIFRMRAKAFDTQAASRLADLDKEEAAWKARIATYQQTRAQLLKKLADSPPSEREAALAELQQAQFSAQERPRLAAYEN